MLSVRDVRRFPLSCGSGLFRISRGDMTLKCPRQNTGKYNFKYAGKKSIPDLRLSFQAIQLSSSCTMFYPCVPCETCEVHAPRTPCGQYWPQLDMLHSPSGFPFRISRGTTGCGIKPRHAFTCRLLTAAFLSPTSSKCAALTGAPR